MNISDGARTLAECDEGLALLIADPAPCLWDLWILDDLLRIIWYDVDWTLH